MNDETAVNLQSLLNKYNIAYTNGKGNRSKSVLGSYAETYTIIKTSGIDCGEFIFGIIENASWNETENGYATYVMRSLKSVYSAHPDIRKRIFDYLSKEFRQLEPEKFKAYAVVTYPKRDYKTACILYLEDLIVEHFNIPRRIYLQNERLVTENK